MPPIGGSVARAGGMARQDYLPSWNGEALQTAVVRGEGVNDEDLVRLTHASTRCLAAIAARKAAREPVPVPFAQRLAAELAEAVEPAGGEQ